MVTATPSTTEQLIELATSEPRLNLTQAGLRVGVTRERVRQLANKHNLRFFRGVHTKPPPPCGICGSPVKKRGLTYHRACREARTWTELTCGVCGRKFRRRRCAVRASERDPRYKGLFTRCSKDCHLGPDMLPCSVCEEPVKLGAVRSYQIRKGKSHGALCGKKQCKSAWSSRNCLRMRQVRAARLLSRDGEHA